MLLAHVHTCINAPSTLCLGYSNAVAKCLSYQIINCSARHPHLGPAWCHSLHISPALRRPPPNACSSAVSNLNPSYESCKSYSFLSKKDRGGGPIQLVDGENYFLPLLVIPCAFAHAWASLSSQFLSSSWCQVIILQLVPSAFSRTEVRTSHFTLLGTQPCQHCWICLVGYMFLGSLSLHR